MKAPAQKNLRRALLGLVVVVIVGLLVRSELRTDGLGDGFASGNGRIEATEIDVATKLGGRIREISVDEGDFVQPGQIIARMDTEVLEAQLNRARARCARRRTRSSRHRHWSPSASERPPPKPWCTSAAPN